MLTFRSLGRFCRTKTYIDRFTALESEINRIEVEIIERQAELDKIQAIVQLSPFHNALKKIMNFLDKPYENVALNEEKQKAKQLYRQLQLLEDEGKSRLAIALKLKKEEEARREELFLTDLAKFSQQYHQTLQKNNFKNDIKIGLELSCKALDSILEKERVQWFGENNEIFDHEKHERVQGEGNKPNIEKVFEKGLIIRGNVIEKAKVK